MDLVAKIEAAIRDHLAWKDALTHAIETGQTEPIRTLGLSCEQCSLGRWLHEADFPDSEKKSPNYGNVMAWHGAFHREAASVLHLIEEGQLEQAKAAMLPEGQRYYQASAILIGLLQEWLDRLVCKLGPRP